MMGKPAGSSNPSVRDEEQLRLLSVFYYVLGSLGFLVACVPIVHVLIGMMMILSSQFEAGGEDASLWMGWIFVGGGGFFIILGWAMAGAMIYTGWSISQNKNYPFCLTVSALSCLMVPFGTILGVFSLVVLLRSSIQRRFGYGDHAQDRTLSANQQKHRDRYHLWLLSIFHYVLSGLTVLFSLGYLLYLGFFHEIVSAGFMIQEKQLKMPFWMGAYVYTLGGLTIVLGSAHAILLAWAGVNLQRHKRYTFCLVLSAINCVYIPFGTPLGIFTLWVLMRDSVKKIFGMRFAPNPSRSS